MTSAPVEPTVRSFVKEHAEEVEPVLVEPTVEVEGWPVRAAWTFEIVALDAPNEESNATMASMLACVRPAACAIGASESIDVAIASPVATAATFAIAFVVTVCITIVNDFRSTIIIKLS